MRRFIFVAGATLLTYFSTSLLFAQHGGGHSGGGHSSGASAHISSGYTGISRSSNAPGVLSGARAPSFSGYTGINPGAIPLGGRRTGRAFVPFFGYPYYLSTFDDYSQPFYYGQPAQDPYAQTDQVTANLMGEQIHRLNAELEEMRAQQSYVSGGPVPYRLPSAGDPPQNDPPITLVMTNGNKLTMQSYAVMNGNFWDFSRQPARKIPLNTVDLAASRQATEASGAEFPAVR
jgi:hypothetical protein